MAPAWLALWLAVQDASPLPEGNAFVRGLVGKQRHHEDALNDYTYDVLEVRENLDRAGAVTRRRTRRYEVFHVEGRPLRRLVAEDDRPLPPRRQAKEDERVRELAEAVRAGKVVVEQPGVRLSLVLERYDFQTVTRDDVDGRAAVVLDFHAVPGKRRLDNDRILRQLAGRIWVDEAEKVVVRAEVRSTGGIKFALGLAASIESLGFKLESRKVDDVVWLPWRVETAASGRVALVKGFRTRTVSTYGPYRRFRVEQEEKLRPPSPPPDGAARR
jgi:hypothetical protein